MERKSTKRRLDRPELKVRERFESIFRVIIIYFFLAL